MHMNALLLETRNPVSDEATDADRQALNPLDLALRCVDRSIRGMGYPGFETQMLVWLSGRVDVGRLRRSIERLSRRRPVITARLAEDDHSDGAQPFWQFTHEASTLQEIDLPSGGADSVLAQAEEFLSMPHDPADVAPLRFYLLRRSDGDDVFLMQYNHMLMDQSASVVLLEEIKQLSRTTNRQEEMPRYEPRKVVSRWLRRIPHRDRQAAVMEGVELQGRTLRGRAALLGTGEEDKPRCARLRIATRSAGAELSRAIRERSGRLCGLPSFSMSILGCAFRAIWRLGSQERNADRNYVAGIGLDMNLHRVEHALLQNLLSVVPVFARPEELIDRDGLIRGLCRQLRDRLAGKFDLCTLRLVNAYQRKPRHIQWVVDHMLRWTYSLWYAYFGCLDGMGGDFCGAKVENVQYVGPTWSPLGISFLVNQFQQRLCFQATYDPDLVDERLAEAFLDFVLDDLARFAAE
jgi:hypothetical protein